MSRSKNEGKKKIELRLATTKIDRKKETENLPTNRRGAVTQ